MRWNAVLGAEAERDLTNIVVWTTQNFGAGQAKTYSRVITATIRKLRRGPTLPSGRVRDDITPGLHLLDVTKSGKPTRHFLLYCVRENQKIEVIRILHVSMVPGRRLPPEFRNDQIWDDA
jgi:plasmid stabilization system protein ParE